MKQLDNTVSRFNKLILQELKDEGINCWVAGGAVRDYCMGIPLKTDYDLFFPSVEEYDKCKNFFWKKQAKVKWESDNGMKVVYNGRTFDLIKKFFNSPKDTINEFDFTVSMFAVDNESVYYGESSFIDLAKKQLVFNKITYPASTLSRSFRYYKKGFTMCNEEMKKLYEAINTEPKIEAVTSNSENNSSEASSGDVDRFFIGID